MRFALRFLLALALFVLFAGDVLAQNSPGCPRGITPQSTTVRARPAYTARAEAPAVLRSWREFTHTLPAAWFSHAEATAECQCENCSCEDCQCSGGECHCEGCSATCSCEDCSCENCQCLSDTCTCESCSASCQCENCSCENCPCSGGECQCEGCSSTCHANCSDDGCTDCECVELAFTCPGARCFDGNDVPPACPDTTCELGHPCCPGDCRAADPCNEGATCDHAQCDLDSCWWCGPPGPRASAAVCDDGAPVVRPLPPEIREIAQTRDDLRRWGVDPFAGSCFDQQGCGALQFAQLAAQHAERVACAAPTQGVFAGPPCPVPGVWHPAPPTPCETVPPAGPRMALLPGGPQVPQYPEARPQVQAGFYPPAPVVRSSHETADTSSHLRQISRQLEQQAATLEEAADYGRADELRHLAEEVRHQARMLRAEQLR